MFKKIYIASYIVHCCVFIFDSDLFSTSIFIVFYMPENKFNIKIEAENNSSVGILNLKIKYLPKGFMPKGTS